MKLYKNYGEKKMKDLKNSVKKLLMGLGLFIIFIGIGSIILYIAVTAFEKGNIEIRNIKIGDFIEKCLVLGFYTFLPGGTCCGLSAIIDTLQNISSRESVNVEIEKEKADKQ